MSAHIFARPLKVFDFGARKKTETKSGFARRVEDHG